MRHHPVFNDILGIYAPKLMRQQAQRSIRPSRGDMNLSA